MAVGSTNAHFLDVHVFHHMAGMIGVLYGHGFREHKSSKSGTLLIAD